MRMEMHYGISRRRGERGSALAIALVFLLVLTLLGLSAMRGSNLQERMAGNLRDRNMAFQSAEAALRAGEAWLLNLVNQQTANLAVALPNPATWDGDTAAASANSIVLDAQLASNPSYHVGPPALRRVGIQLPPDFRRIYPVTAHAEGGTDAAVVVLQSTFEPPQ